MGYCGKFSILSFLVLGVSLFIGFLVQSPIKLQKCSKTSNMAAKQAYKAANHSAFVIGYTGESGKALVQELAKQNIFSRIVLIGRRHVELNTAEGVTFEQRVVDFEKMEDHADSFKGLDVGYCCLGTTRGKSGVAGFRRVDYDYTLQSAQIAKAQGCQHFHLVSSMGANKNSLFLYPSTKGQVEDAISQLKFPRFSVYRPGFLVCERAEKRTGEVIFGILAKPLMKFFPTLFTTPTDLMARAMINNTVVDNGKSGTEILENKQIFELEQQCEEN